MIEKVKSVGELLNRVTQVYETADTKAVLSDVAAVRHPLQDLSISLSYISSYQWLLPVAFCVSVRVGLKIVTGRGAAVGLNGGSCIQPSGANDLNRAEIPAA